MGEVSQKGVETHAAICAVALEAGNPRRSRTLGMAATVMQKDNEPQPQ